MNKVRKYELEDIDNAIVYDSETKKAYCPKCGREILERKDLSDCPDSICGWRQYRRNSVTGKKIYGD
jgi:predicted RNA-binding Zn-ribbon protein involved in translation (DUF1610 family)